jgi:small subunit ribosomal protein S20
MLGFAGNIHKPKGILNMATKPKKKNPRLASDRTAVKNVEKAVLTGDKAKATELFAKMQAVVDTIADKGIFHKNKAARDKSRLSAKVKALAVAA